MRDFTVKEAYEIIKSLDSGSQIYMTKHFHSSNNLRHKKSDICIEALLNQEILGNEHKIRKSQDLYLIIVINDNETIKLITTYDGNKTRRLGENEGR